MHPKIEYYLSDLLPLLASKGVVCHEQKDIPYGVQLRLSKDTHKAVLNVYYSAKKGLTTVVAGKERSPLRNLVQALVYKEPELVRAAIQFHTWDRWIGSDECGKGDYFGAPVACAFAFDKSLLPEFKRIGICDSKLLNHDRIDKITKHLYKHHALRISCVSMKPGKYNEMIASLKLQHRNLNDLLAWQHATAITELYTKQPQTQGVLVDQFSASQKVRRLLAAKEFPVTCVERTSAEFDPAVAAASIVARYHFLKAMDEMHDFYDFSFPLGATHVINAAEQFSRIYGFDRLGEVAKLHFKTTTKVADRLAEEPNNTDSSHLDTFDLRYL